MVESRIYFNDLRAIIHVHMVALPPRGGHPINVKLDQLVLSILRQMDSCCRFV